MGYYPDMSSQAAAQGYFADLIRQALASAPVAQRISGQPLYVDVGNVVVPANASIGVGPNLGGRGLIGVLAVWNSTIALTVPARVTLGGAGFTLWNGNAQDANMFWMAIAL